jgi:hypothetical protein
MVKTEFAHAAGDVFGGVALVGGHQFAQPLKKEAPINEDGDLLAAHAGTSLGCSEMKMPQGFGTLSGSVRGRTAKGRMCFELYTRCLTMVVSL